MALAHIQRGHISIILAIDFFRSIPIFRRTDLSLWDCSETSEDPFSSRPVLITLGSLFLVFGLTCVFATAMHFYSEYIYPILLILDCIIITLMFFNCIRSGENMLMLVASILYLLYRKYFPRILDMNMIDECVGLAMIPLVTVIGCQIDSQTDVRPIFMSNLVLLFVAAFSKIVTSILPNTRGNHNSHGTHTPVSW